MNEIIYYKIASYDINFLEMLIQSYENLALFSTIDSKVAIIRIIIDKKNLEIFENIINSLDINIERIEYKEL